jgi:hypothetical protein
METFDNLAVTTFNMRSLNKERSQLQKNSPTFSGLGQTRLLAAV